MRNSIIPVIAFTLISSLSFGQELPPKCKAFQPDILQKKVLTESDAGSLSASSTYGQEGKPRQKKYWTVWSDRSDNKTYKTPDGRDVYKTLGFNDELRIAEIQGKYALVYSEPNTVVTYPKISGDAECKGWIPMDHLLLWESCPANERGIYYKALLCINADERSNNYGLGYRNPELPGTKFNLQTDMKFYFIMKISSDGKVLLSTQHNMNGGLSSKVLYAWVPKDSYVPWNQRSCLEPTWEHEDVEYFASKGISANIYEKKSLDGTVASTIPFKKTNEPYEEFQYRMNPMALRFPILDGTNDSEFECSSFTSTQGAVDVRQEKNVFDEKKLAELNKLKKINLVVVIDGTKSMEPYFPAVRKAIDDGCEFFDRQKYEVKVGALIYRDYPDGEGLVESYHLSKPNDPGLAQFLSQGGKYGIKSSPNDHTFSEALYYGINAAIDRFFTSKDESNIMLVVGDCGNDPDDAKSPSVDVIIDKLAAKNVNLVGYQVRNIDSDAWNDYNRQLLTMMKGSLRKKYHSLENGTEQFVRAVVDKTGDGQTFLNIKDDNKLFLNTHKYAVRGSEISPEVLSAMMKNSIKDYSQNVQTQIDKMTSSQESDLRETDTRTTVFQGSTATKEAVTMAINDAWLKQRLGSALTKSKNQLISFRGWTAKKDRSDRDFYKTVLFISSEEFDELMTRLKPVADVAANTDSDNRKPYVDAIKALLKSMAPGLTNAEMEQKGIAEVMNMIEGLNAKSASMDQDRGKTLLQISDEASVRPAEYRRIVNDFKQKYDNLSHIKDSHYKYVREFNGAKYYWIPIENLP